MPIRNHTLKVAKDITRNMENHGIITQVNADANYYMQRVLKGDSFIKKATKKTKSQAVKHGSRLGRASGNIIAMPLHFLFGRGGVTAKDGHSRNALDKLLDRGLIGYGLYYISLSLSQAAHMAGYAGGFIMGVVTLPAKPKAKENNLQWIGAAGKKYSNLAGDTMAHLVVGPLSLLAHILRIPGAILVSTGKGLGIIVGSARGSVLAIKDKTKHKKAKDS